MGTTRATESKPWPETYQLQSMGLWVGAYWQNGEAWES